MDAHRLDERLAWARNRVARHAGLDADAYRPDGPLKPLAGSNRFLRIPALFANGASGTSHPASFGNAICFGHFDHAYTRPGDYLVQPGLTAFIAVQERLQPVVCVRTNATVTLRRPIAPVDIGTNQYGGTPAPSTELILEDWPASMLGMATAGTSHAGLPNDTVLSQWTVLLPSCASTTIAPGDLLATEGINKGHVISAEHTYMGWRLIVRQASA